MPSVFSGVPATHLWFSVCCCASSRVCPQFLVGFVLLICSFLCVVVLVCILPMSEIEDNRYKCGIQLKNKIFHKVGTV